MLTTKYGGTSISYVLIFAQKKTVVNIIGKNIGTTSIIQG